MRLTKRTLAAVAAGAAVFAGSGAALANGLNVQPTALRKAIKDAVKAQIDQNVKDGVLTKAQGDAIKEQIDNRAVGVSAGLRPSFGLGDLDVLGAATDYL